MRRSERKFGGTPDKARSEVLCRTGVIVHVGIDVGTGENLGIAAIIEQTVYGYSSKQFLSDPFILLRSLLQRSLAVAATTSPDILVSEFDGMSFPLLHAGRFTVHVEEPPMVHNIAVHAALHQIVGTIRFILFPYEPRLVQNLHAKKVVVGNGRAGKNDVRSFLRDVHFPCTRLFSPQGSALFEDQNIVDAVMYALYGKIVTERRVPND